MALIAKLDQAISDRVDDLVGYRPEPTAAHRALAAIYNKRSARPMESESRAQVIAQFDYMRAMLPDVFVVQSTNAPVAGRYPLNFAAAPYGYSGTPTDYMLPFGANSGAAPLRGMFGASFEVAAGIYKQLGYGPKGYDGNDNNRDGYVDDFLEGAMDLSPEEILAIRLRVGRHKHKTARSEMLYAILVEGGGAAGSPFDRDDFTSKEVMDTDGDGLMEFVDAWGEPLQFYRWPILYRSDSQKGFPDLPKLTADLAAGQSPGPYSSVFEAREQNPLDPNQTLLDPAWWGSDFNNAVPDFYGAPYGKVSSAARYFMAHFITLVDPLAVSGKTASNSTYWDRSTRTDNSYYQRRAYYSRFLVLSGGPDRMPGVAQLGIDYRTIDDRSRFPLTNEEPSGVRDKSGGAVMAVPAHVIQIENQAGRVDPNRSGAFLNVKFSGDFRNDTNTMLESSGNDDVENH